MTEDPDEDQCCDDWDELSSHYHCAQCGERCSMMGHWDFTAGDFTCKGTDEQTQPPAR